MKHFAAVLAGISWIFVTEWPFLVGGAIVSTLWALEEVIREALKER